MAVRPCIWRGPNRQACASYAVPGGSRCPTHEAEFQSTRPQRGSTGRRGTSKSWARARAMRLKMDGYRCTRCLGDESLQVHHRDGNPDNHALTNLRTLCRSCHKIVTAEDKAKRAAASASRMGRS